MHYHHSLDMDSPFFCNGRGEKLGRLQNTEGSLLRRIGIACGVPDLTPTDFRRSAETKIQKSEAMRSKSDALNMHSETVGRHIYDKSNSRIRCEYVNLMDISERDKSAAPLSPTQDDASDKEMKDIENADKEASIKHAREYLDQERSKKDVNVPLGKRCKVNPLHRFILQTLVSEEIFSSEYKEFPEGISSGKEDFS